MLAVITKASDDYYYELKEIFTIKELFEIYNRVVVEPNPYTNWTKESFLCYWDEIKEEDISLMQKAECHIIIYDYYIE